MKKNNGKVSKNFRKDIRDSPEFSEIKHEIEYVINGMGEDIRRFSFENISDYRERVMSDTDQILSAIDKMERLEDGDFSVMASTKKSQGINKYRIVAYNRDSDYDTEYERAHQFITDARNPPIRYIGGPNGMTESALGANIYDRIEEATEEMDAWNNGPNSRWFRFDIIDDNDKIVRVAKSVKKSKDGMPMNDSLKKMASNNEIAKQIDSIRMNNYAKQTRE